MWKLRTLWMLGGLTLAVGSYAGSPVYIYTGGTGDISQQSPPGGVTNEQGPIIDNDGFGNQRSSSIVDGRGNVIAGLQPCKLKYPTANMDCSGYDLRGVQWDAAQLSSGRFEDADLRGASLRGASLENASFDHARLQGADLRAAQLANASFISATLSDTRFDRAELINSEFINADLSRSSLRGAKLINTGFAGADLSQADLRGAKSINTDFDAARLSETTWLDGARCPSDAESTCR